MTGGAAESAAEPLAPIARGSAPLWPRIAVVVLAAAVVWGASLRNGPLGDDGVLLDRRLADITWASLPGLLGESYWGSLHPGGGLYRPAALMLLGAQRLLFGVDLAAYRLVTMALHAIASVLVLRVLERSGGRGALAGALLFAVHPIHAESVTTAYGQQDVAAGVLALAALSAYLACDGRQTRRSSLGIAAMYFVGMTFKEQVVLLPLLLVAWQAREARPRRPWGASPLPWCAVALLLYGVLRVQALGTAVVPAGAATIAEGYPWWARATLVVTTLGTYVRLLAWPSGQTTYYGHLRDSIFGGPTFELALLGVAVAGVLVLYRRTQDAAVVRAAAVVAVFLLPVANIAPIGTVVAERCLYLPVLAVSLLAALAWRTVVDVSPRVAAAVATSVVLLCVLASVRVAVQWRTPLSHWRATAAAHPESPKAHASVAILLLEALVSHRQDQYRGESLLEVEDALATAFDLNSASPDAWRGQVVLHAVRGECPQAAQAFKHLRAADPDRPGVARLLRDACR